MLLCVLCGEGRARPYPRKSASSQFRGFIVRRRCDGVLIDDLHIDSMAYDVDLKLPGSGRIGGRVPNP